MKLKNEMIVGKNVCEYHSSLDVGDFYHKLLRKIYKKRSLCKFEKSLT